MNFGSWNGQQMAEKLGSQLKRFLKTCTSRGTVLHCAPPPTIGASTTIYLSNYPPHLRQHPFRFSHILNIPTSTSHSRLRPYRINFTFSNRAGDALLNITHKDFFILATVEIYTTILTIDNTSPDPTLEQPYYTCASSSSSITSG